MARIVFVLSLLLSSVLFASSSVNLVPESRYLIDTQHRFQAQNVLEHLDAFSAPKGEIYNFGFVEDPIWILFQAHVPTGSRRILRIDNPHIDRYDLYRIEGDRLRPIAAGGDRTACETAPQCRTFQEFLPRSGRYMLHLQTEGALQVPLYLEAPQDAQRQEALMNLLFGFYYGVLCLLLIYNLVLYVVVREIHYVNYLLFLGSYMLFQLSFDGVGREWLWPDSVWMANDAMAFFIFLSAMFAFRFARYFLLLRQYEPKVEKMLRAAEAASLAGVAGSLLLSYHTAITLAAIWSALTPWLLIYAGFKVLPRYRAARYYLAGWIVFLLATILVALNKLGVVPMHPAMLYAQQIGSLLQMILLSFALADRINMMKQRHMRKLREYNDKLQEKIQAKIAEIREKDRMMIQQSRQAAMGEMIENIAHQWRQPLNQLSLVQSGLFFDFQLGTLDDEKLRRYQEQAESLMAYMTQTIDDFRNFFLPDRKKKRFDVCRGIERSLELLEPSLRRYGIDVRLQCPQPCTVVGHENEFSQVILNIVNNAKDAMVGHAVADPKIEIGVQNGADAVTVRLCDNGGGVDEAIAGKIFDPYFTTKFQSQGTGIGLYMVKMIVEKSFAGTVRVENVGGGACFIITLPKERTDAD